MPPRCSPPWSPPPGSGLQVNVTGWLALAENMPSGSATRPGDVLRMYSGKTVEVLNTDAEGRLVLADAIVRAGEENPDAIVDVATLTGAMVLALGNRTFGDHGQRRRASATACTTSPRRPASRPGRCRCPAELRKGMDSPIADIANMGERMGGGLVAGLFLQEFVGEGITWAHLDIAGPAFHESAPFGYTPKGGTGTAVRTLVRLAERTPPRRPRLRSAVDAGRPGVCAAPGEYAESSVRPRVRSTRP